MHFYPYCMKNNRSRNDIVSAILEAVNQDASSTVPKTRIMYRAFLSYAQLKSVYGFSRGEWFNRI